MFGFLTKKEGGEKTTQIEKDGSQKKLLSSFSSGLVKTRQRISAGLANIFLGKKVIAKDLWQQVETVLLQADLGLEVVTNVLNTMTQKLERNQVTDIAAITAALKKELIQIVKPVEQPLLFRAESKPFVVLVVGVNGVGKTTTIGKVASNLKQDGYKVQLAAGDTFRAGAIAQLNTWGERLSIPVVKQEPGADSAAVLYDALVSAKAKDMDVLLADTAGRLHTQKHLMAELEKVVKVIKKLDNTAPHEVLLVLDASIGQNAIKQAEIFSEHLGVTGLVITKLDGTAKGGVVFNIANKFKIPIRFCGIGETAADLKPFVAEEFVAALFD